MTRVGHKGVNGIVKTYSGEPNVEARIEQPYVGIPIVAGKSDWEKVNGLIGELFDWLKAKNIKPAGTPFFRYWCLEDAEGKYKMEVGVPVHRMVTGNERVVCSYIPGGTYVTAVHTGHPDELENLLQAVEKWAQDEQLAIDKRWEGEAEIWNGRFEFYVTDSEAQSDWNKWAIEIAFLLVRDDAA